MNKNKKQRKETTDSITKEIKRKFVEIEWKVTERKKRWILKCKKIHKDEYDYSKVNYINNHTKIKIICKKHGNFLQIPNDHLQGCGCTKCKFEKLSNLFRSNTREFVEKSIKMHGNKYDYSKVNYINSNIKVKIVCNIHGQFFQTPHGHVNYGCSKCAIEKLKNRFISKKTKRKLRLSAIKRISKQVFNGGQLQPSFNKGACEFIEEYGKQHGYNFQHAMNGGEFHIKELGYWVDGYDKKKNVVIEYDEMGHSYQKEKDIHRMNEIKQHLDCKFIRYNEKLNEVKEY